MKVLNVRSSVFGLCLRHLLFAVLAVSALSAKADVVSQSSAYADFISKVTGAGTQTITYGSGGTPIPTISPPSLSTNGGGTAVVTRSGSLALPGGVRLPITATSKIPSLAAAALIKKALPLIPYLSAGIALYDLVRELGFTPSRDSSGTLQIAKESPPNVSGWKLQGYDSDFGFPNDSPTSVWVGVITLWYGAGVNPTCGPVFSSGSTYYANCYSTYRNELVYSNSAASVSSQPSSLQDFADIVAAKSAWSSGSSLSAAIDQAQRVTGDQIPVDAPTVTGPATVDGPLEVTKTSTPYGDMAKSIATKYDCTYVQGATVMDGGSAICTQTTTTTETPLVTNPSTGVKTVGPPVVTSTTSKPVDSVIDPNAKKPDPKTDCEKFPDNLACVKVGEAPTPDVFSKAEKAVSIVAQTFAGGSGSCPAPIAFVVFGKSYAISYQPLCDQFALLKYLTMVLGGMIAAFILADSFRV